MSGFSSENTMMRRTRRTSSPHTEIARVTHRDRRCDVAGSLMPRLPLCATDAPPEALAVRRGDREFVARDFRDHPPAAEDQRAMADPLDLLEVRRDQEHRHPALQRELQQVIDLGLGADVDADRRLLEDEQPDLRPPSSARRRPSAGCRRRAWRSACSGSSALIAKRFSAARASRAFRRAGRSSCSTPFPVAVGFM